MRISDGVAVPSELPVLDIEYVPTPGPVVDKMLEVANLDERDVLYDLGCGDGRMVIETARQYGARAVGFDLDPQRLAEARNNVAAAGVDGLVRIEHANIFTVDLRPATVVTLYLLPSINVRLVPQLQAMAAGARIISHDYDITGFEFDDLWVVVAENHRKHPRLREHAVLKWTTPLERTRPGEREI